MAPIKWKHMHKCHELHWKGKKKEQIDTKKEWKKRWRWKQWNYEEFVDRRFAVHCEISIVWFTLDVHQAGAEHIYDEFFINVYQNDLNLKFFIFRIFMVLSSFHFDQTYFDRFTIPYSRSKLKDTIQHWLKTGSNRIVAVFFFLSFIWLNSLHSISIHWIPFVNYYIFSFKRACIRNQWPYLISNGWWGSVYLCVQLHILCNRCYVFINLQEFIVCV